MLSVRFGVSNMSGYTCGAMLRRFREAKSIVVLRHNATWSQDRTYSVTMSQNELASRAGVDPAYVNKLETGKSPAPRRPIVLKLADALDLGVLDRDCLLIAAGYVPDCISQLGEGRLMALLEDCWRVSV